MTGDELFVIPGWHFLEDFEGFALQGLRDGLVEVVVNDRLFCFGDSLSTNVFGLGDFLDAIVVFSSLLQVDQLVYSGGRRSWMP